MRDIVNGATRLHNFVIDFKLQHNDNSFLLDEIDPLDGEPSSLGYRPTAVAANDAPVQESGRSDRRKWIRAELDACGLQRPLYNIDQNFAAV